MPTCFIVTSIALLSAPVLPPRHLWQGGMCYHLTQTCGNGKPKDVRKGDPLTDEEMEGVQAAIDMLDKWERKCGVEGPTLPMDPSDVLQSMLSAGAICRETAADPAKVGVSASNPSTGSGTDASGCSWATSGHPGMNITSPQIPKKNQQGTFDAKDVASLAGQLLHELQHLLNPNNNANNQKEYEEPAYRETIKQLCKVAGCAAASQEEKDAVCDYILSSNKELCRLGAMQECCDNCPSGGKIHCDGSSGGATGNGGGGLAFLGGGQFLDTTVDERYSLGDMRGRISLNVASQIVDFLVWDETGTRQFYFDCATPQISFTAVSFAKITSTDLLLGGFDSSSRGELVRLAFDPLMGAVVSADSVLVSSDFATVGCMDSWPDKPKVAFLDHVLGRVFIFNHAQGTLQLVADTGTAPLIAEMNYLHVWRFPSISSRTSAGHLATAPRGYEIWATYYTEEHLANAVLVDRHVRMIDANGDGVFESILQ